MLNVVRTVLVSTALACAGLAGCGPYVPPDTAQMTMVRGFPVMTENDAINLIEYYLARPESTHGLPALGARAVASADWLAGRPYLTGDYGDYAPVTRIQWVIARREWRAVLGIAPGTPSQVVVDHLLFAAMALEHADRALALAQLQPPAFTLGPDRTLDVLGNLPYLTALPNAATDLQNHLHRDGRCDMMVPC